MFPGLPLLKILTHAKDDAKTGSESEFCLLDELLVSLAVVLPSLRVSEDGPLAADG